MFDTDWLLRLLYTPGKNQRIVGRQHQTPGHKTRVRHNHYSDITGK